MDKDIAKVYAGKAVSLAEFVDKWLQLKSELDKEGSGESAKLESNFVQIRDTTPEDYMDMRTAGEDVAGGAWYRYEIWVL